MKNEPNISIYDAEGGAEDFPVLKAFQQYIDAEQAKARRRLITVSTIFGVVLVAVIVVFSIIVTNTNDRNQVLNDRLVDYAMKEADSRAEFAKASAIKEAEVRTMTETMQRLQRKLEEQERKANEAAAAAARELAAAKTELGAEEMAALNKRQSEMTAKLQKAIALLKSEKAKVAEEKEKIRQQELEKYRREHYPKFYAKKDAEKDQKKKNIDVLDDIEDALDEATKEPEPKDDDLDEVQTPAATKDDVDDLDDDKAIEYFKDDSYTIPVEVKGKSAGWHVPLD